jgi:hypothetical protein
MVPECVIECKCLVGIKYVRILPGGGTQYVRENEDFELSRQAFESGALDVLT